MHNDSELLKIRIKDDEIKDSKNKTEKHNKKNILKSLKLENECYEKKNNSLIKKEVFLFITGILIGSGSAITSSTLSKVKLSIGVPIASCSSSVTSIAILIANEYISKLKIRYTKLRDWISVVTLLYEKTLEQSMMD